jgi:hypothetical protein
MSPGFLHSAGRVSDDAAGIFGPAGMSLGRSPNDRNKASPGLAKARRCT